MHSESKSEAQVRDRNEQVSSTEKQMKSGKVQFKRAKERTSKRQEDREEQTKEGGIVRETGKSIQ